MARTYAVTVECSAGGEDNAGYDAALAALDEKVVDSIVRDDGSAVFWIEWNPSGERITESKTKIEKDAHGEDVEVVVSSKQVEAPDGAQTWMAAKDSIDHILSTFAGAGVLVHDHRVGEHEVSSRRPKKSET